MKLKIEKGITPVPINTNIAVIASTATAHHLLALFITALSNFPGLLFPARGLGGPDMHVLVSSA